MREVMNYLEQRRGAPRPIYKTGRKKPIAYDYGWAAVLGHYESTCGGCDNIGSAREVFETIHSVNAEIAHYDSIQVPRTILMEGLLLSEDTKWSLQMPDLRVIFLSTPLEQCLSRVKRRRESAGNDKPLNPSNTTNRIATIERARIKLADAGVLTRIANSKVAPGIVIKWLTE